VINHACYISGSLGLNFLALKRTESQCQTNFYPYVQQFVSFKFELIFGRVRCHLKRVPPQPNFPPENVVIRDRGIVRGQNRNTQMNNHYLQKGQNQTAFAAQ